MAEITEPYVLDAGEGEAVHFLNTLVTIKAGLHESCGYFTFAEHWCPPGFAIPHHVHRNELEVMYLLDGSLDLFYAEIEREMRPGDFALLPSGVAHGYQVSSLHQARFLTLTSPGGFERVLHAAGRPADERALPQAEPADIDTLLSVFGTHGVALCSDDGDQTYGWLP